MEALATPDLDAERDPGFVRQSAAVSRATRWVMGAVVGLALAGVFGGAGPLAQARATSGALAVDAARFARLDAPLVVRVALPPGDSAFTLTGDLAGDLRVEAVAPAPSAESTVAGGRRYVVDAAGGAVLHARPLRFGVLRGSVRLDGGREVGVRTVVYP